MKHRDYAKDIKRPNDLYYDPFTQRIVVLDSTVKVQNLSAMIHNEMARYAWFVVLQRLLCYKSYFL